MTPDSKRKDGGGTKSTHILTAVLVIVGVQITLFGITMQVLTNNQPQAQHMTMHLASFTGIDTRKQQQRRQQQHETHKDKPVGSFNGYKIYYKEEPVHSSVQCVGSNFQRDQKSASWIHRSCKFRHFCFDLNEKDFVLYESLEERALNELSKDPFFEVSTTMNTSVAIGGINNKWTWKDGVPRLNWFPAVKQGELTGGYYELDEDVVWAPFHSLAAFNPGHLVWDDFLPVYTLLRIFQLLENRQLLMMRYILKGEGLWASCDMSKQRKQDCRNMLHKFLPLMGLSKNNFTTTEDYRLTLDDGTPQSNLVCARHGVAGVGMLTDHGVKLHGWHKKDYEVMHNHGRGAMLYEFRNFMVSNLGLGTQPLRQSAPFIITFSLGSSDITNRNSYFQQQRQAVVEAFGNKVVVKAVEMRTLSIVEQVKLTSETAVFLTVCGGGAVTATFLPLGATLIVYYEAAGGHYNNRPTGLPARLDWDFFNNAAYMRTHWVPIETMDTKEDLDVLVKLIQHELHLISHQEY